MFVVCTERVKRRCTVSEGFTPGYYHRQKGPWAPLLYLVGVTFVAVAWLLRAEEVALFAFVAAGVAMFVVGTSFHHLAVVDEGDRLVVRFGPFPLFRKRIDYAEIGSVETGRTLLLDGWGIHLSVRGGWVWNIWGRECVVIRHGGTTTRVGTDDAENLIQFLKSRLAAHTDSNRPTA
jgi:hypothetical protein